MLLEFQANSKARVAQTAQEPVSAATNGSANVVQGAPDDVASPIRPSPTTLAREVVDRVSAPLRTPLLSTRPRPRSSRKIETPRRSGRLAAKSKFRARNPTKRAQNVVMQKLGLAAGCVEPDDEAIKKYKSTFAQPLSASKYEALQTLLSDDVNAAVLSIDVGGLDDDDVYAQ